MDLRVVVGLNVQRIRREQTLSQEELSFRSGFTRSYLSGLEAGRRNPTILSLAKIASALGASVDDLIRQPTKGTAARSKVAPGRVADKRKLGS
ncbi:MULTISPECIES: helix-turn-helix domain-containing protein [unclassified Mesorhizobium]|uniref:helix-turn-helix domain-containing protein n=1 Tax=unclassified Mesorhizobium TaxID=325217 RepID=UPI001CC91FBC|nr:MULTISPECIES: helix-turn-helix transcriptional regulator [unclassified Mesorhizobium]MBZ9740629.1 helix-turn-helix transcriptional regulator [Mesorhizobium sp. CO1-1-4]MBZ9775986.1 helix-turn-helix transcriptional regulator [Mesorhizobium sp. CO1-1-8]